MASSTVTTTGPIFSASGLSSGLDTASIIDSLVAVQSAPVTTATNRQAAFTTQISQIADLSTKLQALSDACAKLKTGGVLGVSQVGSTSGFTATPSTTASPGNYSVQVDSLASAAKARSAAVASGNTIAASTLTLGVNGTSYPIDIADGSTLDTIATQINQSGAAVNAAVLTTTNGTRYLAVNAQNTAFTPGQPASSALSLTETVTGTTSATNQALGLAVTTPATNASVNIDGLSFERSSNVITDALPGVTLSLKLQTTTPETLQLTNDATFVDAYNSLMTAVNGHLNISTSTDRSTTLAGDPSVRALQTSMHNMISGVLNAGSTRVRTLADVGVMTGSSGALYIDSAKVSSALASDSAGVNALFQTSTTGLGDTSAALSKTYTDGVDGIFTTRTTGLNNSVKTLGTTIDNLNLRLAGYRKELIASFAAMETVVGNFKSTATYLTQQAAVTAAAGK
jgi:flagellar hook-associated protein 2